MKNKYEKLSLILGILALIEGGIIYWLQKDTKEFEISNQKNEITYNTDLNDSIYVITLKISNSGNQPIDRNDYSSGLTFNTGNNKILKYKLITAHPGNLHIDFEKEYYNQLKIKPFLFNQGNEFYIQINTKKQIDTLFADVSILGIDNIKISNNKKLKTNIILNDLESIKTLKIISATYGFSNRVINLTESINKQIKNNSVFVTAQSQIDPYQGKVKLLKIKYIYSGFIDSVSVIEGNSIKIPVFRK